VKNLIEHIARASEILVITFTRAAADDMRARFAKAAPGLDSPLFATFHSFFYSVIRFGGQLNGLSVLSGDERRRIVKAAMRGFEMDDGDEDLNNMLNELSLVKNELIDREFHSPMDMPAENFRKISEWYENFKEENNKIDFDDMLTGCYRLASSDPRLLARWAPRVKYILIDEFQDINRAQYETIKLFAGSGNIFVVGDDDQSIYRFRGSRPEFLLRFADDFPETKKTTLNVNYRSTNRIVRLCNKLIAGNKNRFPKQIDGAGKSGRPPALVLCESARDEAAKIAARAARLNAAGTPYGDIAVLYRVNSQSRALADAFMDARLPFIIKDDAPGIYEHWICRDIRAYFRLAQDRADNEALELIINKPKRYVSKSLLLLAKKGGAPALSRLRHGASSPVWLKLRLDELVFHLDALKTRSARDAVKYLRGAVGYDDYVREYADYHKIDARGLMEILSELQESAQERGGIGEYASRVDAIIQKLRQDRTDKNKTDKTDAVTLSTIHSAKGLEYGAVFVAGVAEGLLPYEKSKTEAEIEEERRLMYVAMTRAKERLIICARHKDNEHMRSRFLDDITDKDLGGPPGNEYPKKSP
jgi:DNA helicase-2/ATP-dependent DNA helicase PcrA